MRERGLKPPFACHWAYDRPVAPHAGAWIETCLLVEHPQHAGVAPHAGAWIETSSAWATMRSISSLPMRERGLKQAENTRRHHRALSLPMRERGLKPEVEPAIGGFQGVAPHAGAWIETSLVKKDLYGSPVAPHAGAWIETHNRRHEPGTNGSLPMRERGLKHWRQALSGALSGSLPMRERGLKRCCSSSQGNRMTVSLFPLSRHPGAGRDDGAEKHSCDCPATAPARAFFLPFSA